MATEKELDARETAGRAESIARGLACSPGFVARLRAQYLDAVRAHDADTTETFLAMCAAGAALTTEQRNEAHAALAEDDGRCGVCGAAPGMDHRTNLEHDGLCFGACCLGKPAVAR